MSDYLLTMDSVCDMLRAGRANGVRHKDIEQLRNVGTAVSSFNVQELFDVFITFAEQDRDAGRRVVQRLESAELSVLSCDRDLPYGAPTLLSIERAVARSRRQMFLLSEGFLRDCYCDFTLLLACDQAVRSHSLMMNIVLVETGRFELNLEADTTSDRLLSKLMRLIGVHRLVEQTEAESAITEWTRILLSCSNCAGSSV